MASDPAVDPRGRPVEVLRRSLFVLWVVGPAIVGLMIAAPLGDGRGLEGAAPYLGGVLALYLVLLYFLSPFFEDLRRQNSAHPLRHRFAWDCALTWTGPIAASVYYAQAVRRVGGPQRPRKADREAEGLYRTLGRAFVAWNLIVFALVLTGAAVALLLHFLGVIHLSN